MAAMRAPRTVLATAGALALLAGAVGTASAANSTVDLGARPVFLVASGAGPDAMTAGPVAAKASAPLLYTDPTAVPQATADYLSTYKPTAVVLVGGTAVISEAVKTSLAGAYTVSRYGGANRQETAVLLAGLAASLPTPTGPAGATGAAGPVGANGTSGAPGATGPGVAAGGTTGQVLSKVNGTDYNTTWTTPVTTSALSLATFQATAVQSFAANTYALVSFASPASHTSGATVQVPANYSGGSGGTFDTVTAPADGFYQVSGAIRMDQTNSSATGERYLALTVTGHGLSDQQVAEQSNTTAQASYNTTLSVSQTVWLYQGDYVRMRFYNNTSSTLSTTNQNYPRLSIAQLPLKQPIG